MCKYYRIDNFKSIMKDIIISTLTFPINSQILFQQIHTTDLTIQMTIQMYIDILKEQYYEKRYDG